jgi:uncharacterized membrane protein
MTNFERVLAVISALISIGVFIGSFIYFDWHIALGSKPPPPPLEREKH